MTFRDITKVITKLIRNMVTQLNKVIILILNGINIDVVKNNNDNFICERIQNYHVEMSKYY